MKNVTKKSFWTWNWFGGGYNSVFVSTREEALAAAKKMGDPIGLKVIESSLRAVTDEEMAKIDRSWASAFD